MAKQRSVEYAVARRHCQSAHDHLERAVSQLKKALECDIKGDDELMEAVEHFGVGIGILQSLAIGIKHHLYLRDYEERLRKGMYEAMGEIPKDFEIPAEE